jgi:hypothetical protein
MATWRSGDAAVCKTVYPGSIPGVASTRFFKDLELVHGSPFRARFSDRGLAGDSC